MFQVLLGVVTTPRLLHSLSSTFYEQQVSLPFPRGVQVLDTKRGPKSPKFPPKIGFLRGIFDIQLSNTSHTPTIYIRSISVEEEERRDGKVQGWGGGPRKSPQFLPKIGLLRRDHFGV